MFIKYHLNSISNLPLIFGISLCTIFGLSAQSLDTIKIKAAENNLELKAIYKSFEASLEEVTKAKSWQDPSLSFGYFISPIETRVGPQIAKFSLSQMLPWFGTYKAKGNIATYKAEAEFAKFQNQKLKLFLEVANRYYELTGLRQTSKIEKQQVELLKNLKTIVQSNYENNKANLVDVLRVELEIDKQLSAIAVLKDQDQILVTQLNQILNRPLRTPISISKPKQILESATIVKIDSFAKNHPRLEAIQNLQESNNAKIDLAKKQAMPQFGFGVDYAIIQDRNVNNTDAGQDAFMPMLSLSLPIFGKKNKSIKKVASLQGKSLKILLEDEKIRLESEMHIAQYKYNELLKLVELHDNQMKRLNDMIQLSHASLANAKVDIEEVIRLYEEKLIHHKMKIKNLAELQKIKETINYLTLK